MIKRPANSLPAWTKERADSGEYGVGSLVWYQADENSAGYAYRAKSTYVKSTTPPSEDDNWEIDYSFAAPWNEKGKYKIGARVYYFNGQMSYVYIASNRYYGGNGKPNEEVDLDGIRTWELEMSYNEYSLNNLGVVKYKTELLVPVRKHCGYTVSKTSSFIPFDPEERPNVSPYYFGDTGQQIYLEQYFNDNNIVKDDFSDINSVYQSYAYDSNAYNFYSDKPDSNGVFIHLKKGMHRAEFVKKVNPPSDKWAQNGKKQFVYTANAYFSSGIYWNTHGFSIEMWPTASDDEYEFVPTEHLKDYYFGWLNNPFPYYSLGIDFYKTGYAGYSGYSGFGFNGDTRAPDDQGPSDASTDESLKLDAYFFRTSPAFSERQGTIYMIKTDTMIEHVKTPWYSYDENGNETLEGYYYVQKNSNPTNSIITEGVDSNYNSYNTPSLDSFVRSRDAGNPIDFTKHRKNLTITSVLMCGFKIE
jgi:hypothetical protein